LFGKVAWPLMSSLMVSAAGALALLGAATMMMLRYRKYASGVHTEQQVELARRIQLGLLPSNRALAKHFDLAADWQTAGRVGGDFYDAFDVPGKGSALVFGDVSGKDLPAAMLTGVIHGATRSSSWTDSAAQHSDATMRLNKLLCEQVSKERFVSMVWSYLDQESGLLHYVNAGHCAPLLFRANGQEPSPIRLCEGGPVLGLLENARYEQGVERLEPGDVVVFYTDGIIEAARADGEEFGERRLIQAVESGIDGGTHEIRDRVRAAVRQFTNRAALEDDRTLVVVRYQPKREIVGRTAHELVAA